MPYFRALLTCTLIFSVGEAVAQIRPPQKIGFETGGFTGELDDDDNFGTSIAFMGDIDEDGVPDLAVGAPGDDDGGGQKGAVWILFMNADGTVRSNQKISETEGGLDSLDDFRFGGFLANATDLNGDGRDELLLGGHLSVRTLFLNKDGTVRTQVVTFGGRLFSEFCLPPPHFAVAGDLNDDGNVELLLTQPFGNGLDCFSVMTLKPDGSAVRRSGFINEPPRELHDNYGTGLTGLGDVDNNGIPDIAISAPGDGDGAFRAGAVYIFLLDTVSTGLGGSRIEPNPIQKISLLSGGLGAGLPPGSEFGTSLSSLGDLDGDGIPDLVAGSPGHPGLGSARGAVHVLFLNSNGTVKSDYTFEGGDLESTLPLRDGDRFGTDVDVVADYNNDGLAEVAVGAPFDDEGGQDRGAIWIMFALSEIPASVAIQQVSPVQPSIDERITVSALVAGVTNISSVNVNWRRGGDQEFNATEMNADGGGQYSASIPNYAVSERGIEYFVSATTSTGVRSRFPVAASASIVVSVPDGMSGAIPGGISEDSYRLISVPIALDEKRVRAIFESSLGPYDAAVWRLYALESGSRLIELDEEELVMEPGKAFWMLAHDNGRVYNTGSGASISTSQSFPIRLNRDWNLVGNPFAFDIPVGNLTTAQDSPFELWRYDGAWTGAEDVFRPFEGYAVFSERADTLLIDPNLSPDHVAANANRRDRGAEPGKLNAERRSQLETLFRTAEEDGGGDLSAAFRPYAYPNPFVGSTTIDYELKNASEVNIHVFDVVGREVVALLEAQQPAGAYKFLWNGQGMSGRRLAPGLYMIRIQTNGGARSIAVSLVTE